MHDIVGAVLEFLGDAATASVEAPNGGPRWLRWLRWAVLIFITLFMLVIVGLIIRSR
jgi:uncharacterized protein involved in cysteine biosynthesis